MGRREKIDCRANGEVIFRATRSLSLKVPKHVVTGSSAEPNESHSLISTKNGIDSGFASLIDEKYLQVNQVCLEPGQQVPHHKANSNVTLTMVYGEGTFQVGGEIAKMGPGKLLRIPFQSPMSIKNESKERLAFLVIKAPHPSEMK